jgi:hypothetical protein
MQNIPTTKTGSAKRDPSKEGKRSPHQRALISKISKYYDSLSHSPSLSPQRVTVKLQERKSSRSRKSPERNDGFSPVYEDDLHTGQKLDKLHDLMTKEFEYEEQVRNLDPKPDQVTEAA